MLSVNRSWLGLSLPLAIEGPVSKVTVGRLVVAAGVESGVVVGAVGHVVAGVVESLMERSGVSLSFWL